MHDVPAASGASLSACSSRCVRSARSTISTSAPDRSTVAGSRSSRGTRVAIAASTSSPSAEQHVVAVSGTHDWPTPSPVEALPCGSRSTSSDLPADRRQRGGQVDRGGGLAHPAPSGWRPLSDHRFPLRRTPRRPRSSPPSLVRLGTSVNLTLPRLFAPLPVPSSHCALGKDPARPSWARCSAALKQASLEATARAVISNVPVIRSAFAATSPRRRDRSPSDGVAGIRRAACAARSGSSWPPVRMAITTPGRPAPEPTSHQLPGRAKAQRAGRVVDVATVRIPPAIGRTTVLLLVLGNDAAP